MNLTDSIDIVVPAESGENLEVKIESIAEAIVLENEGSENPRTEKLRFIRTAAELYNMHIRELPYLVEPIIQQKGLVSLVGSSDVGKSMFLRQMALAIVKGEESFLGFKINAQNRNVIIVSTEDDDTSTSFLLRKQLGEMEDTSALTRLRYIFDTYDIPKKLRQTLDQQPADLIILDAFSDLYSDEMNNVYKVRKFLNDYHAIAKKYDCLIAFLHHTGKRTEDGTPSKNNVIGSQGFEAKMRTVLELRRDMNDDTIRHLCAVKGNYLKDSDKNKSFILKFEEMTYTNTGDRQAFSKLGKADNKLEENQKIKTRVHALKKEKKSVRGITKILKDEGMKIGKTKVAEILKDEMSESFIPEVKDGGQVE